MADPMTRLVDVLSVLLLIGAAGSFAMGINALADKHDLSALYWLVVGALVLRAATDMLRPRAGSR